MTSQRCCNIITTDMAKSQVPTSQTFGEFFRQKRVDGGFTLRSFCKRFGFDPAYISRVERGIFPPPEDKIKLRGFAKSLGVEEGSEEWVSFFDLAFISKGKVPTDILGRPLAIKYLPLLFRTARGQRLSKKKLQELANLLHENK